MPLIPDDVNEIFDSIIDTKHPELEFPHHASAWLPFGYTGGYAYNADSWQMPVGGGTFWSSISAPVGSRITRVKFGYNRASAGTISLSLIRKPLNGGAVVVVANDTDNVTVGATTLEMAGINHLTLAANGYALRVIFDAASAAAGSVLVGGSHSRDRL